MGAARWVTQRILRGPVLLGVAILGGWLRLDRLYSTYWRWTRRPDARLMHPLEIHEAQRVFGNSIPFEDVRIVEDSPLVQWIARLSGRVHLPQGRRLAVALFFTLHFSIELSNDNSDMPWLIHELTHVWQYCRLGPRYFARALQAQAEHGKAAYDPETGLAEGWAWDEYNLEQQADLAADYYRALVGGQDTAPFKAYVDFIQGVVHAR